MVANMLDSDHQSQFGGLFMASISIPRFQIPRE